MLNVDDLRQRLGEFSDRAAAIQKLADEESRDITAEEQSEIDSVVQEFDRTEKELERRKTIAALGERSSQTNGRKTKPIPPQAPANPVREPDVQSANGLQNTVLQTVPEKGRWGFAYFGEFLNAVKSARITNQIDPRLIKGAATTWGSEGIGEDGGFAVPPDWRSQIMQLVQDSEDSLLGRTDQQQTSSNQIVVPVDEKAAWHTTGVRAFWVEEASATTQTKPAIKPLAVRANKLMALVYLTDEILEDAASMGAYVNSKAPEAINWEINDALVNGIGVGKPLGILKSPCLVSVAKETSQAAATLLGVNVIKMWARMLGSSRSRAVWLVNQDIEPQMMQMNIPVKNVAGTENVGGLPVYIPPGGLSASPFGNLLGRPVIPTEACATIGTQGDIILADLSKYLSVMKRGGIRAETSIHVEFEKDLIAFRFILRIGGQPWLSAPIARKSGSNTLSHFVTLDTRA